MATEREAAKRSKSPKKSKGTTKRSARATMSIVTSVRKSVAERAAALAEAPLAATGKDSDLQAVLNVLGNEDEPIELRFAALESLQAATFTVDLFAPYRGDYIATLRKVADDPNPDMRQRVLGLLARQKDGFAQKKLLEGLRNPEKALVPPEKALQLLSYDVHAEAYSAARAIVSNPPNDEARREALRLLAADAKSAPLFENLLRDKNEFREIRQISASALHALKPEKMREYAREILLDKSDYDDIKATSLTALEQFGDSESLGKDKALMTSISRLAAGKTPTRYKQAARQFLSKYGR